MGSSGNGSRQERKRQNSSAANTRAVENRKMYFLSFFLLISSETLSGEPRSDLWASLDPDPCSTRKSIPGKHQLFWSNRFHTGNDVVCVFCRQQLDCRWKCTLIYFWQNVYLYICNYLVMYRRIYSTTTRKHASIPIQSSVHPNSQELLPEIIRFAWARNSASATALFLLTVQLNRRRDCGSEMTTPFEYSCANSRDERSPLNHMPKTHFHLLFTEFSPVWFLKRWVKIREWLYCKIGDWISYNLLLENSISTDFRFRVKN